MFSIPKVSLHRFEGLSPQEVGIEAWFVCHWQFSFPWKVTGCICGHWTGAAGVDIRTLLIVPEIPSLPCRYSSCSSPGFSVGWSPEFPFAIRRQKQTSPGSFPLRSQYLVLAGSVLTCPHGAFLLSKNFSCGSDQCQKEENSACGSLEYSQPQGQGGFTGSPNSGWSNIAHKYVVDTSSS